MHINLKQIFFSLFIFTSVLSAAENTNSVIYVSSVKLNNPAQDRISGEIVLNDNIKILNIVLEKKPNSTNILKLPEYISKRGKIYPQVRILDKKVNDEIIRCMLNAAPGSIKGSKEPAWEISKFSLYRAKKKSVLRIFASVKFNKSIEIECKVFDNDKPDGIWVNWPSKESVVVKKEYIPQVIIKKELREKIEKELIKKYLVFKEEGGVASVSDDW